MYCPHCRTANQDYAVFCLQCGETLVGQPTAPAAPHSPPLAPRPPPLTRRPSSIVHRLSSIVYRPRWQPVLVLALALGLLAATAGNLAGQQQQVDSYRAGRGAEAARHWHAAVAGY